MENPVGAVISYVRVLLSLSLDKEKLSNSQHINSHNGLFKRKKIIEEKSVLINRTALNES